MPNEKPLDVVFTLFDIGLTLENSAVFQSQIGEQLVYLQSSGFKTGLVALYNDQDLFDTKIGNKLREAGVTLILVKEQGFYKNLINMPKRIRQVSKSIKVKNYYVRGLWGPLVLKLAFPLKLPKYVYDVRGDLKDEFKAVQSKPAKQAIYLGLEKWGIKHAKAITAVTSVLAEKVSSLAKREVTVIPCCVTLQSYSGEKTSASKRNEIGFSEQDIIFIYSGGLSHYQQVPAMLDLWERFLPDSRVKFLLLTNEDPHSHPVTLNELAKFGSRLKHFSVGRDQIPEMLKLANVGFMLRDTRSLNKAASPVKFPEYLAAGLAVAASPGTGDASELITVNNVGVLIDPANLEEGFQRLSYFLNEADFELIGKRSRLVAEKYYNWSSFKENFESLYAS